MSPLDRETPAPALPLLRPFAGSHHTGGKHLIMRGIGQLAEWPLTADTARLMPLRETEAQGGEDVEACRFGAFFFFLALLSSILHPLKFTQFQCPIQSHFLLPRGSQSLLPASGKPALPSDATISLILESSCKWDQTVCSHSETASQHLTRKAENEGSTHSHLRPGPSPRPVSELHSAFTSLRGGYTLVPPSGLKPG